MKKSQEITTNSPAGYHFTGETETHVQIIAIDREVTAELIEFAAGTLGLVYERQWEMEGTLAPDRTYLSAIFTKTDRFDLLTALL